MSEYATIPSGKNWARNPRPASTSYIDNAGTGAQFSLTTERSYSGLYSLRISATNGQEVFWATNGTFDTPLDSFGPGTEINVGIRISRESSSGFWYARVLLYYTDVTNQELTSISSPIASTGQFEVITFPTIIVPAGKNLRKVVVGVGAGSGGAFTGYLGGLDVRINAPLDGFIHGSAGAGYAWEGTADNSPSTRQEIPIIPVLGFGGQFFPTVRVDVVNRKNQRLRDVTPYFVDGSINYDLDAERWKGSCSLSFDRPGLIEPLGDEHFRVTLRVEYPDGSAEEGSLGMFIVDPPKEHWDGSGDLWTYEGKDLLAILDSYMFRSIIGSLGTIGPGAFTLADVSQRNYLTAISDLLTGFVALSPQQYSFGPDLNRNAAQGMFWEGGTSALKILTDLLISAGWQRPWVTPAGVITSTPSAIDPALIGPAARFATGRNSKVRWPFDVEQDTTMIANRVRVVGTANVVSFLNMDVFTRWGPTPTDLPENMRLEALVTNQDPSHPLSFQRLGRWIDLPDVDIPIWIGQAEANSAAQQVLYTASHPPMTARLVTQAHVRGLNEVYELDLMDSYGNPIESGQGRYFCRGWTIQLGPPWEMVHTLKRTIAYEQSVFLP